MIYNEHCYDTLQRLERGTVDLLLQDTPFGVTQNEWDVAPDLAKMWPEWERVCKPNAAMIFFATEPFAADLIQSNRKLFRYDLIWMKSQSTGFLNANKMPLRRHESILVFYQSTPTYNPQFGIKHPKNVRPLKKKRDSKSSNYGNYQEANFRTTTEQTAYPNSILYFENQQDWQHPTQKPIDLIRYLILTYSNPGELVFDGYMGSGTTAIAAMMEGRRYCGSETNAKFYDKCMRRIAEQLQKQTLF